MYDGAEPAGTSVAVLNLLRLMNSTTDPQYRARAENAFRYATPMLNSNPISLSEMLARARFFPRQTQAGRCRHPAGAGEDRGGAPPLGAPRQVRSERVLSVVREGRDQENAARSFRWCGEGSRWWQGHRPTSARSAPACRRRRPCRTPAAGRGGAALPPLIGGKLTGGRRSWPPPSGASADHRRAGGWRREDQPRYCSRSRGPRGRRCTGRTAGNAPARRGARPAGARGTDHQGDEEPRDGRDDRRQMGDPLLQREERPPRIAGREMRKENFAARRGAIPSRRARMIVEPERDSPGKTASPWITPIAAASHASIRSGSSLWRNCRLLMNRNVVRTR